MAYAVAVANLKPAEMMYSDMYSNASDYEQKARNRLATNKDGKVSKDEFMAKFPEALNALTTQAYQKFHQQVNEEMNNAAVKGGKDSSGNCSVQ